MLEVVDSLAIERIATDDACRSTADAFIDTYGVGINKLDGDQRTEIEEAELSEASVLSNLNLQVDIALSIGVGIPLSLQVATRWLLARWFRPTTRNTRVRYARRDMHPSRRWNSCHCRCG